MINTASERILSINEVFGFARNQITSLLLSAPDAFPTYTHDGKWVLTDDPWAPSWSGGFLTGILWVVGEYFDDEELFLRAKHYCNLLDSRKFDETTHDLGFIIDPSFGRWFDLFPNNYARETLIQSGSTMGKRFRPEGQYLCSWVDPGSTFIDIMMNVGIVFRAAKYTNDHKLFDIGLQHSLTSRRYLQRGDGSTVHEAWFDTATGEFLRTDTHQGLRSDSSWARGQAWAIYGFSTAYTYTNDERLLNSAIAAADYFIAETPKNGIPPNDWLELEQQSNRESSAAAIAAAAFLHLSMNFAEERHAKKYRDYGFLILRSLLSTEFVALETEGYQGVLMHATYHKRNNIGVDESVMWGDYYFLEALSLAKTLGYDG